MAASKMSVNASKKDRVRDTSTFAKGGKDKMFKPQSAGPQQSGITGKNQTPAPGARAAKGGPKILGFSVSLPAQPGHCAPIHKGR